MGFRGCLGESTLPYTWLDLRVTKGVGALRVGNMGLVLFPEAGSVSGVRGKAAWPTRGWICDCLGLGVGRVAAAICGQMGAVV
jgi:hypothetical protein